MLIELNRRYASSRANIACANSSDGNSVPGKQREAPTLCSLPTREARYVAGGFRCRRRLGNARAGGSTRTLEETRIVRGRRLDSARFPSFDPASIFSGTVVPEYAFGLAVKDTTVRLSHEHVEVLWSPFARRMSASRGTVTASRFGNSNSASLRVVPGNRTAVVIAAPVWLSMTCVVARRSYFRIVHSWC